MVFHITPAKINVQFSYRLIHLFEERHLQAIIMQFYGVCSRHYQATNRNW